MNRALVQYEVLRCIFQYLPDQDLDSVVRVSRLWHAVGRLERRRRNTWFPSLCWSNAHNRRHRWFAECGNSAFNFHLEHGLLQAAVAHWLRHQHDAHVAAAADTMTLVFATGVTYLNYLHDRKLHFVIEEDLSAAEELRIRLGVRHLLLLTTLRTLKQPDATCDAQLLHLPVMPVSPPPHHSVHIRPFHMTSQSLAQRWGGVGADGPRSKKGIRQANLDAFTAITGVDPSSQRVLAMVVFNVCEMINPVRQVWQDFGPFPFVGCDSEGLSWLFSDGAAPPSFRDYHTCTSGFVLASTDSSSARVRVASIVTGLDDVSESKLSDKFMSLSAHGFGCSSSRSTWGVMLSSCMRGYDGDDIGQEHIEQRNRLQQLECRLFAQLVGHNFVGAQVEDVYGTHCLLMTGHSSAASPILTDDCSSAFLVVQYY